MFNHTTLAPSVQLSDAALICDVPLGPQVREVGMARLILLADLLLGTAHYRTGRHQLIFSKPEVPTLLGREAAADSDFDTGLEFFADEASERSFRLFARLR